MTKRFVLPILFFQLTWMRPKDLLILTSGVNRYTSDDRVRVKENEDDGEWTLSIKSVTKSDAGKYECQVSFSIFLCKQKLKQAGSLYANGISRCASLF